MLDLNWQVTLNMFIGLAIVVTCLGMFSNLSWTSKTRLTIIFAVGFLLIGILCWPLVKPDDPFQPVSLVTGNINFFSAITILAIAFITGLLGFFVSWPLGKEMAIVTVPAGLCVWSFRSASMADFIINFNSIEAKYTLLAKIKWEPFFWLAVVAAGYAGVWLAQKMTSKNKKTIEKPEKNNISNVIVNAGLSTAASLLISTFCVWVLAQDVKMTDNKLGFVIGQPHILQICFAVLVAFAISGFVVKKFLSGNYIWPLLSTSLVTFLVTSIYVNTTTLKYMSENWPANFFQNSVLSILPVQMIAFGCLGSIAGYWLAVRLDYWKEHHC
ncbi:MAG TPA: hypothetical protein PLP05_00745 [Sedimentisphaerales bacterium]|nr:hypothetical protein [Sedimentisphaerales bacterium]